MSTNLLMSDQIKVPPDQRPEAWSATALHYDMFAEQVTLPFAEDAARLVPIGPGTRVLDIAAGTGNFAFAAAQRGARVLATDFADGMLEILRRKAQDLGLTAEIETRVMDGQALDLPDASFDVAGSIFGLLFFPDHDRGIREMLRVLVPGGRAVIATWAPPPRGDMTRILGVAMAKALPDLAPPSSPMHWTLLGDADALRARLLANGFARAHVVELRHVWVFDRVERFTDWIPKGAPPMAAMFASMSPEQRKTFIDAIADDFRARQGDGPYAITHEALVAVGTKGGDF
jgi:SAM-dependent methyltransferase